MEAVEYDSDDDDGGSDLSSWLQKLSASSETPPLGGDCGGALGTAGRRLLTQSDTVESFRYSVMMDLESSNACDLDDIINDLCALEAQLSSECVNGTGLPPKTRKSTAVLESAASSAADEAYESRSSTTSSANSSLSRESGTRYLTEHPVSRRPTLPGAPMAPAASAIVAPLPQKPTMLPCAKREQTPVSSPSAKSPTVATVSDNSPPEISRVGVDAKTKEEKILLAIQKIKDADIKKLFVKVFIENGDCKTLLVDENMTTFDVVQVLFDKCPAFKANVRWAVIEQIPELFIERIVEDHEKLVIVMLNWLKVSNNRVLFLQTDDKYDLFFQPQNYLLEKKAAASCSERDQKGLLDDLFGGSGCQAPELESDLHVKIDGQKSWKKITAVLRSSGIYLKKGKASRAALQCVVQFDQMDAYRGFNWKRKHKAPSEHCFALKRADVQRKSKDGAGIKYFCCDDDYTLKRWLTCIRVAKYGMVLNDNFKKMLDLVATSDHGINSSQAGLRAETGSHGSRDSGFSIASGGSSGSLDGGGSGSKEPPSAAAPTMPPPRQLPQPPLEFCDLPPPPPELLRSACSTPAMSAKHCHVPATCAASSPALRHVASDSPMYFAAQSSADVATGAGLVSGYCSTIAGRQQQQQRTPSVSTPRNSGASSSSSSRGSTPCSSIQSLNAADAAPCGGQQQRQPPAVPVKSRASSVTAPFDRMHHQPQNTTAVEARPVAVLSAAAAAEDVGRREAVQLQVAAAGQRSPRMPFERLDPSRRTCPCPVTPKRTTSVKQPDAAAAATTAPLAKQSSLDRPSDASSAASFPAAAAASQQQQHPNRPAVAAKPVQAVVAGILQQQQPTSGSGGSVAAGMRSVGEAPGVAARSPRAYDSPAVAFGAGGGGPGKPGFLHELSTVYARRGLTAATKPVEREDTVPCDIDDLPPPPPELLLDLPPPQQPAAAAAGCRSYESSCSVSNGDKLHYNMGQMFASQTGTIKRAPPPPPKRQ